MMKLLPLANSPVNPLSATRALGGRVASSCSRALKSLHLRYLPQVAFAIVAVLLGTTQTAGAQSAIIVQKVPEVNAKSYLLIDAGSGKVLADKNADETLPPASLTKIMTSFVAATELAAGRVQPTDAVEISVKAWRMGGSKMFIREGTTVPFEDLLKGVIIQSGNDASVAIAEHIAGDEAAFADMMNQLAKDIGMTQSNFMNASGLPNEDHYTTARDLSILTRALIERFPEHYELYSQKSFRFNDIDQPNRNRLLWRDKTVDGVKTGHTNAAGYCLVSSALRNGQRLISVVMGTDSDEARMKESQKLLSYGFRNFETRRIYDASVMLKNAELWFGEVDTVELGIAEDLYVTIPRGAYDMVSAEMNLPELIEAPLEKDEVIGELRLTLDGEVISRTPLVTLSAAPEAGFFTVMWQRVVLFFQDLISGD